MLDPTMVTENYVGLIMISGLAEGQVSALNFASAQGTNMTGEVKDKLLSAINEKADATLAA